MGMPFLGFEVWESHAEGHTRDGGRGMGTEPGGMNECSPLGIVAERFQSIPLNDIRSMEALAKHMGINDYVRLICGYHIHGARAALYEPDRNMYCALDWYAQGPAQRTSDPSVWEHFLILDQVCPTECIDSIPAYARLHRLV